MSYDDETDRIDWKDEIVWILIAVASGVALSMLYFVLGKFSGISWFVLLLICCVGFYVLGVLLRIQNYRGRVLVGRTLFPEERLKFVFPALGFIVGIALVVF